MKRMRRPSACSISRSTAFRRSSNSPRYFAPATMAPRSSATTSLSRSVDGTSPSTIRCARPSTMAVLPVPGSPMSTGLFFVRRESTWITRRISSVRPITGSSFPSRAACVRFRLNRSRAWNCASGFWSVTRAPERSSSSALSNLAAVMPARSRILPASPLSFAIPISRCSVETYASFSRSACLNASEKTLLRRGPMPAGPCTPLPLTLGIASMAEVTSAPMRSGSAPTFCKIGRTTPLAASSSAFKKMFWFYHLRGSVIGRYPVPPATPPVAFTVSLSKSASHSTPTVCARRPRAAISLACHDRLAEPIAARATGIPFKPAPFSS